MAARPVDPADACDWLVFSMIVGAVLQPDGTLEIEREDGPILVVTAKDGARLAFAVEEER